MDQASPKTLATNLVTAGTLTVEICRAAAAQANLKYFGVEFFTQCWGDNNLPAAGLKLSETSCNSACPGLTSTMCGGNNALSVYSTLVPGTTVTPSTVTPSTTATVSTSSPSTSTPVTGNAVTACATGQTQFITATGVTAYHFSDHVSVSNPPLQLVIGRSYTFINQVYTSHPLYIKTVSGAVGTGSLVSGSAVIGQGQNFVFFTPDSSYAGKTIYYQCGNHVDMTAPITFVQSNC